MSVYDSYSFLTQTEVKKKKTGINYVSDCKNTRLYFNIEEKKV